MYVCPSRLGMLMLCVRRRAESTAHARGRIYCCQVSRASKMDRSPWAYMYILRQWWISGPTEDEDNRVHVVCVSHNTRRHPYSRLHDAEGPHGNYTVCISVQLQLSHSQHSSVYMQTKPWAYLGRQCMGSVYRWRGLKPHSHRLTTQIHTHTHAQNHY